MGATRGRSATPSSSADFLWRRPGHGQLHAPGARARHARRGPLSSHLSHSRRLLRLIFGGLRLPVPQENREGSKKRRASGKGEEEAAKTFFWMILLFKAGSSPFAVFFSMSSSPGVKDIE